MAFLILKTVHIWYRIMGQATSLDEVLSLVQIDPKSPPRTLDVYMADKKPNRKLRVSEHAVRRDKRGALVDRGANGGIIGDDAHVIHTYHSQEVDVTGIDNHEINSLKVVDASAKITTQRGDVIGIFRQYAYHGKGRTIHSSGQMEWFRGNKVKDRSIVVGGSQNIRTLEGYVIPIDIISGLPYIKMVPNTQKEFDELPHVVFTSSEEWDPTVLDCTITNNPHWFDAVKDDTEDGYYVILTLTSTDCIDGNIQTRNLGPRRHGMLYQLVVRPRPKYLT